MLLSNFRMKSWNSLFDSWGKILGLKKRYWEKFWTSHNASQSWSKVCSCSVFCFYAKKFRTKKNLFSIENLLSKIQCNAADNTKKPWSKISTPPTSNWWDLFVDLSHLHNWRLMLMIQQLFIGKQNVYKQSESKYHWDLLEEKGCIFNLPGNTFN